MIPLSPEEICDELNRSHKVGATFYIPERLPKDGHYQAIAKAQAEKVLNRIEKDNPSMWNKYRAYWQQLKQEVEE